MTISTADLFDVTSDLDRGRVSWRRMIFPSVFLVYLVQTGAGVVQYQGPVGTVVGIALILVFCGCYVLAMTAGRLGSYRRFWRLYWTMIVLTACELPFARDDTSIMFVYIGVLSVAALWLRSIPVLIALCAIATVLPKTVPSWHGNWDLSSAVAIAIVSLAMFGFFAVLRSNEALTEARLEVARLATENERARIARDLHDLLGHSLTTITVKAGLARRLTEIDPERAAIEIAEVEALARSTLTDVRGAVSGYREVTLANELAAAAEVLRAAGIGARLPGAIDGVDRRDAELFGWVVREGVTNVVRHSRAQNCEIRLGERSIEICDDGVGGTGGCGNGLSGLAERVAEAGGTLDAGSHDSGWLLRVGTA